MCLVRRHKVGKEDGIDSRKFGKRCMVFGLVKSVFNGSCVLYMWPLG